MNNDAEPQDLASALYGKGKEESPLKSSTENEGEIDPELAEIMKDEHLGGDNFNISLKHADAALDHYEKTIPGLSKFLKESGAQDKAVIFRLFASLGRDLSSEDQPRSLASVLYPK